MKYYAGIGSRESPLPILKMMRFFAKQAAISGWTLRSGAAPGADTAFELGCDDVFGPKEILLPWKGFSGHASPFYEGVPEAEEMAATIHPAWKRLSQAAKKLVSRNMQQINGPAFDAPVEFVVCWTKDGCESHLTYGRSTGGTGTAICAASRQAIPVYNFFHEHRMLEAFDLLCDPSSNI